MTTPDTDKGFNIIVNGTPTGFKRSSQHVLIGVRVAVR